MKKALFYTFLGVFIATAIVTLLGITNLLQVKDGYLGPLFTALLIELIGSVVGLYRATKFFDEAKIEVVEAFTPGGISSGGTPKVPQGVVAVEVPKVAHEPGPLGNKLFKDTLPRKIVTPIEGLEPGESRLEDVLKKLDTVKGRFVERDKFLASIQGERVYFRGLVSDVVRDTDGVGIILRPGNVGLMGIGVGVEKTSEEIASALREGDMIDIHGILKIKNQHIANIISAHISSVVAPYN